MSTDTLSADEYDDSSKKYDAPDSPKDADDHIDLPKRKSIAPESIHVKNGIETMKFSNGVYYGEFKDGKMDGKGVFTFNSGSVYTGDFKDDLFHGYGTYVWSDGKKYKGQYYCGKREGFGKQKYKNSNVYEGEWKNDKKEGKGKMVYTNDCTFKGTFQNNKKHGTGIFVTKNGERVKQIWVSGKLIEESKAETSKTETPDKSGSESGSEFNLKNHKKEHELEETVKKLTFKVESQKKQLSKIQRKFEKMAADSMAVKAENLGMKELLSSTKKQLEEEKSKSICVICYERERDTILLPCMHFNLCFYCTTKVNDNRCPTCRTVAHGRLQSVMK